MLTALVRKTRQVKLWKPIEGILMCQCGEKGCQSIRTLLLLRLRGVQLDIVDYSIIVHYFLLWLFIYSWHY